MLEQPENNATAALATALVSLRDVHKSFQDVAVIRGVDFALQPGELVTLLGVNGAGKTTIINMILGLLSPSSGQIQLLGHKPRSVIARRQVGVTPQSTGFPEHITVGEVLSFVRAHYPSPMALATCVERFGLQDLLDKHCQDLSGGQKRRLAIAQAFVGQPRCVFLDEPTTGLDVESRQQVWAAIRQYVNEGGSVFLTTHYLEEAEQLSTRIIILEQGVIKQEGTVAEIKALAGMARVGFLADDMSCDMLQNNIPGIEKIEQQAERYTLHTHDSDHVVRALVNQNIAFRELTVIESSLESAYLQVTEDTERGFSTRDIT